METSVSLTSLLARLEARQGARHLDSLHWESSIAPVVVIADFREANLMPMPEVLGGYGLQGAVAGEYGFAGISARLHALRIRNLVVTPGTEGICALVSTSDVAVGALTPITLVPVTSARVESASTQLDAFVGTDAVAMLSDGFRFTASSLGSLLPAFTGLVIYPGQTLLFQTSVVFQAIRLSALLDYLDPSMQIPSTPVPATV